LKKPFLGVFLMNQPVPPAPQSLNMRVSPENRAKFTGFLEGVKSKAVTSQMPPPMPPQMPMQQGMMPQGQGMGMPPMPPQGMMPPMQPPMMMNMGGMVDVFDPRYMNEGGFVISTDDSGKIATRPVFDEDKGRMVSQILSRDMVQDMADKAETPSLGDIISEQIISENILDNVQRADDSLKGVPDFTTTTIEPNKPMISLPAPKPKIQLPVSKPEFSDIKVPVSKPNQDTINEAIESFLPKSKPRGDDVFIAPSNKNLISEQIAKIVGEDDQVEDVFGGLGAIGGTESGEVEDVSDPQTITDFILGRGDAVFDTPTLGNLSRNVIADRFPSEEEEEGLGLLAKILNLFRPQYNRMGFGEELGVDQRPFLNQDSTQFNDGGIVQGFSNGGFTSNLRAAEPERARQIEEDAVIRDVLQQYDDMYDDKDRDDLGSATPIFKDLRMAEDEVESINPMYENFKKSQESMFAPVVNKIGSFMGYDDPFDLYKATQATLDDKSMQSSIARDRLKDQQSAERKLEEEQRLRNMIQGMLPPTAGTPAPPMVTAPDAPTADPATPDYSSVVVPSDRVPGFDVGNISPYPQFRMPTEYKPIFPPAISANYFKDLFNNMGVKNMNQGGSVNQLDSAIDNFINAYK
jgi:hypothetical protein